jgi:DNA-binding NtrC family response regulator
MRKPKILVIDDEEDMLRGCGKILEALGYFPLLVSNPKSAAKILEEEDIDVIFSDLFMPEVSGMQIINIVKKYYSDIPVIIFTAYGTIDRAVAAIKAGAFDFIEKPFDAEQIDLAVKKALKQRNLFLERKNLLDQLEDKFKFDNIVSKSPQMRKVFELIENVAQSDINILITGESGTGKELIARSIHAHSKRKTKPFVPVNCGAFPENLFESEIFGYERGSFTGAGNRKAGLLEYADGGTFFMDEVCELPLNMQTKLLRTLQDKQFRRVGGNELIQADIRLISATNEDVEQALNAQKIREDFYYRLNVINIHLPPLREREGDIPLLSEYFLRKYSSSLAKEVNRIDDEVIEVFENCKWNGNIRELENVIERAVTLARGNKITLNELPRQMINSNHSHFSFDNLNLVNAKQKAIEDIENKYLLHLLKKYKGNITKMADEAGMTRRNIHRLLTNYGLNADDWRE